jgi:hypothetical protein
MTDESVINAKLEVKELQRFHKKSEDDVRHGRKEEK